MALTNFTLPFGTLISPWSPASSPLHPIHQQLAAHTNNLLYSPAEHQQQADGLLPPIVSDLYKNNPYALPHQQSPSSPSPSSVSSSSSNPIGAATGTATATTTSQFHFNVNNRRKNTYLPPLPPPGAINTKYKGNRITFSQQQQQQQQSNNHEKQENFNYPTGAIFSSPSQPPNINHNSNGNNKHLLSSFSDERSHDTPYHAQSDYFGNIRDTTIKTPTATTSISNHQLQQQHFNNNNNNNKNKAENSQDNNNNNNNDNDHGDDDNADEYKNNRKHFPERPPGFTRVQAGKGSRTQVHAVLDYDLDGDEEEQQAYDNYYDEISEGNQSGNVPPIFPTAVTPVQGPIYVKNGTVPVVPLYSYPTINNGTLIQIPIWWTALSVALGLNVSGDIIKGVPCIKRFNQLFCPTAGNNYPIEKIERFIDDNKALMRRMYGDFEMSIDNVHDASREKPNKRKRKRRFIDDPDFFIPPGIFHSDDNDADGAHIYPEEPGETYFGKLRNKRQTNHNRNSKQINRSGVGVGGGIGVNARSSNTQSTGRLDACESKIEIVTPYWASNSAGKVRAIVNTQHFEQAIHQEICSKAQTSRCQNECGCEQKYKWHRLLAYDPDNDCKGIFMDWFLFPSCCVCRCKP